jgi:FkbM family methyltransferase
MFRKRSIVKIVVVTVCIFIWNLGFTQRAERVSYKAAEKSIAINSIVSFWDFGETFDGKSMYDSIKCIKSKVIMDKSINLCLHSGNDWITREFSETGIFEYYLVVRFLRYLIDNPDWLVIDVGAQLGMYTLFGASTGTKVLAVEPFYDNQIRLHKAAVLSDATSHIKLITNALSNKRNEVAKLKKDSNNIGAQGLIGDKDLSLELKNVVNADESKYYVRTIWFDDILDYVPLNYQNQKFKKAILKIDIEGFEPYAFQHASKLFDEIQICIIFMEWNVVKNADYLAKERDEMLDFLYSRGYTAYSTSNATETLSLRENYKNWSYDIIWTKKDC